MLESATIDQRAKTLTLVLTLDEPRPSMSGKTLVVASTHGNVPADIEVNGKTVVVGANAYIQAR